MFQIANTPLKVVLSFRESFLAILITIQTKKGDFRFEAFPSLNFLFRWNGDTRPKKLARFPAMRAFNTADISTTNEIRPKAGNETPRIAPDGGTTFEARPVSFAHNTWFSKIVLRRQISGNFKLSAAPSGRRAFFQPNPGLLALRRSNPGFCSFAPSERKGDSSQHNCIGRTFHWRMSPTHRNRPSSHLIVSQFRLTLPLGNLWPAEILKWTWSGPFYADNNNAFLTRSDGSQCLIPWSSVWGAGGRVRVFGGGGACRPGGIRCSPRHSAPRVRAGCGGG